MKQAFQPAFWFSGLLGIFWAGSALLSGSPLAFLLGAMPLVLPIALIRWNGAVEKPLQTGVKTEVIGLEEVVPHGRTVELILSLTNQRIIDVNLDLDGVTTRLEVEQDPQEPQKLKFLLSSDLVGEVYLHGMWVTWENWHGLTRESQYVSIDRTWLWGLKAFEPVLDLGFSYPNDSNEDYGEVRRWHYGDQGLRVDKRATMRTGHVMVRDNPEVEAPLKRIVIGPISALQSAPPLEASLALSRAVCCLFELSAHTISECLVVGPQRVHRFIRPDTPSSLYNLIQANVFLPLEKMNSPPEIDPHYLREHLLATHKMNPLESHLPGAWLGWFGAGGKEPNQMDIYDYWQKYGPRQGQKHGPKTEGVMEGFAPFLDNSEETHWIILGQGLADRLQNTHERRLETAKMTVIPL